MSSVRELTIAFAETGLRKSTSVPMDISLHELHQLVCCLFDLDMSSDAKPSWSIKYEDADGDAVYVTSEMELQQAFRDMDVKPRFFIHMRKDPLEAFGRWTLAQLPKLQSFVDDAVESMLHLLEDRRSDSEAHEGPWLQYIQAESDTESETDDETS